MDANMDMDTAWCLTCSKRTRDARSTYCSDACRLADTAPALPPTSLPLTSPVPVILSPTSRSTPRLKPASPTKSARPAISPLVTLSPEADISPLVLAPSKRRAFSFPAPDPETKRAPRQSNVLPPFARKSSIVNKTSPVLAAEASRKKLPESVFLSTSESEPDEPVKVQLTIPQTLPESQFSTLRSQLSSRSHLRSREAHSPVAALVASSASSRSREDIISWAKAVGSRPDESDEDNSRRGRSRTRRREVLANLPPPSTEPLDEEEGTGPGTTPKGRIGSALAGLGMTGFVKALTGVASPKPAGLQAVPAPAEVSRVAVVASTADEHYPIGATPTLSTISFSEVPELSVGTHDHVDVVTDDQSMASDYFRRSSVVAMVPVKPPPRQTPSIWNLSSYLRSLAPFSISSVIAPYAPFAAASAHPTPASSTPSLVPMPPPVMRPTASAPAPIRTDSSENTQAHELVRSLPMDIMFPQGIETAPRNSPSRSRRSRSRSRPERTRSRSRSRSRGRSGDEAARSSGGEGDVESDGRRGRSRKGKPIGDPTRTKGSKSRTDSQSRGRGRTARA